MTETVEKPIERIISGHGKLLELIKKVPFMRIILLNRDTVTR